jgi:hypothetical protein
MLAADLERGPRAEDHFGSTQSGPIFGPKTAARVKEFQCRNKSRELPCNDMALPRQLCPFRSLGRILFQPKVTLLIGERP